MSRLAKVVREIPVFEPDGDWFYFTLGKQSYGMSVRDFRAAVVAAAEALRAFDNKPDTVVPLCELCIRHDLPRHSE